MDSARVLAIEPFYRGFGFAVLEGPERLIDWGVAYTIRDKNTLSLGRVALLAARYNPDVIALEDCSGKGSRKCLRVRVLLHLIGQFCVGRGIAVYNCPPARVRETFAPAGGTTKHEIATALSRRFPELAPHMPLRRKCWMSENWRTNIFGAVALAFAYLVHD
jgi:hypothetical protein